MSGGAVIDELLHELDLEKARLDALRPLSSPQTLTLGDAWDIAMVYESNRIEGNSLTLRETEMVVARGLTIGGKALRDHLEAVNLMAAWRQVLELAQQRGPVTEREVLALHAIVMTRIDDENAGRYRRGFVRIAGTKLVPPNAVKVPELMTALFAQGAARHVIERAAHLHHGLASIHPFADGNGRTARLVMNIALLRGGFPAINLPADDRATYYSALEAADAGHSEHFVQFVAQAELRELRKWLAVLDEGKNAS